MNLNWIQLIFQTEAVSAANQIDVAGLIATAGPVVKLVLIILVLMSIISWSIIFSKTMLLRSASKKI